MFWNYVMNFMGMGMAIVFLVIFVAILKNGVVELTEPRKYIAVLDLLLMIALVCSNSSTDLPPRKEFSHNVSK